MFKKEFYAVIYTINNLVKNIVFKCKGLNEFFDHKKVLNLISNKYLIKHECNMRIINFLI